LLLAVALGTAGFAMQDILLEPFGGQILALSVGGTTGLTALLAGGMLVAFAVAARRLQAGVDTHRLAAYGALIGIAAFTVITFVSVLQSQLLFAAAVTCIGFGNGLFAVGTLSAAMNLSDGNNNGFALGAWGAVQATAAGLAVALGGGLRDLIGGLATSGALGSALTSPVTGYAFVYQIEVVLLFATLVAIGPLAAFVGQSQDENSGRLRLAEFPG
jgi:BCD family chlorophyll transporter-like MFS transporter